MVIAKKLSLILALSINAGVTNQPPSPSFNCSQATTATEKAICSDSDLAQLDRLVATLYKLALEIPSIASSTKTTQIEWLKNRPSERERLIHVYEKRINELLSNRSISLRAINYLFESGKDTSEQASALKTLLATYLIEQQYSHPNEQRSFNERIVSDLHLLSEQKALFLYCTFRGPYNTIFKAYIIEIEATTSSVKKMLFPKYDPILKQIKLEDTVISPNFSRSAMEITGYEKGAGYGGFSRKYIYTVEGDTAVLQQQQATKDNFDSTYQLTGDDQKDWIVEYPIHTQE